MHVYIICHATKDIFPELSNIIQYNTLKRMQISSPHIPPLKLPSFYALPQMIMSEKKHMWSSGKFSAYYHLL